MEALRRQPPGPLLQVPFQRPARLHFTPQPWVDFEPLKDHFLQSKLAEKHLFQYFRGHRKFIERREAISHLGRAARFVLVGLRGRQAALPAQLWPREAPERHFGILEWDPLFAKF